MIFRRCSRPATGHRTGSYKYSGECPQDKIEGDDAQTEPEPNLDQNSLIILCSDHGEKLEIVPKHGNTLYRGDEANSILLMIRFSGGRPERNCGR
jgi:hypothetical protein